MTEARPGGCVARDRRVPGFVVVEYKSLDSTNDEIRRRAETGAPAGTVIWARQQTAGRGRRGRSWVSVEGNIYCSVLLRPACKPAAAAQLSFVAAVAVAEAVAEFLPLGRTPKLKWPNDVLVGGRKVAGVLLESGTDRDGQVEWLAVGVGINVRHFPDGTEYPATSLVSEGLPTGIPIETVFESFMNHFRRWHAIWQWEGAASVRAAWLERAAGLGAMITVRLSRETLAGVFFGLDADGALLLAPPEGGACRRVAAGDVFFPGTVDATAVDQSLVP